ncbi:hypothetical protein QTN94_12870 [Vibrio sp. M250220]
MPLELFREMDEPTLPAWKVLIVDDEADIHQVTVLVLKRFKPNNRPIE